MCPANMPRNIGERGLRRERSPQFNHWCRREGRCGYSARLTRLSVEIGFKTGMLRSQ